jgi:hypothetical protein
VRERRTKNDLRNERTGGGSGRDVEWYTRGAIQDDCSAHSTWVDGNTRFAILAKCDQSSGGGVMKDVYTYWVVKVRATDVVIATCESAVLAERETMRSVYVPEQLVIEKVREEGA